MDAEHWNGMVLQVYSGAQTFVAKVSDWNYSVLLACNQRKVQELIEQ